MDFTRENESASPERTSFLLSWLERAHVRVPSMPLPTEATLQQLPNSGRVHAFEGSELVGTMGYELRTAGPWKHGAWINVGHFGSTSDEVTDALYTELAADLFAQDVRHHYIWLPADRDLIQPWLELGFHYMHARGLQPVRPHAEVLLPDGYAIEVGGLDALGEAIALDNELETVQSASPSFALSVNHDSREEDWRETLEDPTVDHLVVRHEGYVVGQALIFELGVSVGVAPKTVQLGAVTLLPEHRGRGLGTALTHSLMNIASQQGMATMETNWRFTNRAAARHWPRAGFDLTYVRLHREIGLS